MSRLIAVTGLILCSATVAAQAPTSPSKGTKVVGGAFDPVLQELAPADGLLIGFEISLGKFADREVIQSLRPIFRNSKDEETMGKQYGVPRGEVRVAKAKAGYAVGGVNLRTGLLIDGMSVVFMKIEGPALNRNDTYETVWLGNSIGGSQSTLGGDGIPIVGFAAKVSSDNKQCSGMGLILKYAPAAPLGSSAKSSKSSFGPARASGLTHANFERIENGMTESQVTAILGHPDSRSQRTSIVLTWRQLDREPEETTSLKVTVTLRGGKVAGKNWQVINFPKP